MKNRQDKKKTQRRLVIRKKSLQIGERKNYKKSAT